MVLKEELVEFNLTEVLEFLVKETKEHILFQKTMPKSSKSPTQTMVKERHHVKETSFLIMKRRKMLLLMTYFSKGNKNESNKQEYTFCETLSQF